MAEPSGRAAVLGRPIGHSLSPVLHRAAYAELGLNWQYDAIDCGVKDLAGVLADHADYVGFSCTMPLKRELLRVAAEVSPVAAAIGAANTLIRAATDAAQGWQADNTDWIGIRDALAEHQVDARGRVLILGAGGTAQAALAALTQAASITVAVRDPARTNELRDTADRLNLELTVIRLGERPAEVDLTISTLPHAAADSIELPRTKALLDVVYQGWPTALAQRAQAEGTEVISGAVMLLLQAAAQVELMTGRAAPVEAMRAAMRAAVPDCGV